MSRRKRDARCECEQCVAARECCDVEPDPCPPRCRCAKCCHVPEPRPCPPRCRCIQCCPAPEPKHQPKCEKGPPCCCPGPVGPQGRSGRDGRDGQDSILDVLFVERTTDGAPIAETLLTPVLTIITADGPARRLLIDATFSPFNPADPPEPVADSDVRFAIRVNGVIQPSRARITLPSSSADSGALTRRNDVAAGPATIELLAAASTPTVTLNPSDGGGAALRVIVAAAP